MTMSRAYIICGDFQQQPTTTDTVADYIAEQLTGRGWQTRIVRTTDLLRQGNCALELAKQLNNSDLLIATFSAGQSSLPPQFVKILEAISATRTNEHGIGLPRFAAIACCSNDGHPTETSIELCRFFAKGTGMTWAGGLRVCGYYTAGKKMASLGPVAKELQNCLDKAAERLSACRLITEDAPELVCCPDLAPLKKEAVIQRNVKLKKTAA
jgi:hypothetical protein